MIERIGHLWDHHAYGRPIVITTNIGWKKDGTNPMGAGVAKVAAERFPELPRWYGGRCKKFGSKTAVCYYKPGRLFLFPTKPLDESQPWLSWRGDASVDLIRRSAIQLAYLVDVLAADDPRLSKAAAIALPLPGCGNGNLRPRQVLSIIRQYLDDRFVLFES